MRKALAPILLAIPCVTAAPLDPALVGIWRLDAPGAQLIWQIEADGHYQISGSLGDSGMLEASAGKWTTVSDTSKARQNGTYSINARVLSTTGPLGSSQWQPETAQNLAGGLVPRGLPKMVQDALSALRRTVPDAVLVMIEVKDPAPAAHPLELRFYSKKTNHIYVSGSAGALDLGPPNSPEAALPIAFIDLPRAIETARANGMNGVFGHAILRVVSPPRGLPAAVWQVAPKAWDGQLARSIDAASGKPLDTARVSAMTATDGEITAAVGKAKTAIQASSSQAAGAGHFGSPSKALASCGFQEDFVDTNSDYDKPVTFPAIHIHLDPAYQNFIALGGFEVYVPLRPLREVENRELSKGVLRLDVNFPPGFVFCPCTFLFDTARILRERLEQMAESGCG